mmetsp:Transcript_28776/g.73641  ORF Transcript_28776/g.73641 Transcript_28776/m.73641 type:complete len:132 (-) Transcript_28776:109-504(-)
MNLQTRRRSKTEQLKITRERLRFLETSAVSIFPLICVIVAITLLTHPHSCPSPPHQHVRTAPAHTKALSCHCSSPAPMFASPPIQVSTSPCVHHSPPTPLLSYCVLCSSRLPIPSSSPPFPSSPRRRQSTT